MSASWWEYIVRVAGTTKQIDIAAAAGIDQTVLSRWKKGGLPSAESVVQFARGFGRPPLEALIAADYLTPTDVTGVVEVSAGLADVPSELLLAEVHRRMGGSQLWEPEQQAGAGTDQHLVVDGADIESDDVAALLHRILRSVEEFHSTVRGHAETSVSVLDKRNSVLVCDGDLRVIHESVPSVDGGAA